MSENIVWIRLKCGGIPCSKKSVVVRKSTGMERGMESLYTEASFSKEIH